MSALYLLGFRDDERGTEEVTSSEGKTILSHKKAARSCAQPAARKEPVAQPPLLCAPTRRVSASSPPI